MRMLAEKAAKFAVNVLGAGGTKAATAIGSANANLAKNLGKSTPQPKRVGEVPEIQGKHADPPPAPDKLPDDLQANAGGGNGLGGNAGNGFNKANDLDLPITGKKNKKGDGGDAEGNVREFESLDELNAAANNPRPNTTYKYGDYSWTTDEFGRVVSANGVVSLGKGKRNSLQTEIGKQGNSTDVGFHLFAHSFNGPTNRLNVIPGNGKPRPGGRPNLNQGPWKQIENEITRLINAGHTVEVQIEVIYKPGNRTGRPDSFVYKYSVDGSDWYKKEFTNYY